jgi:two-component system chemotaxis response regulator CheB
VISVLGDPRHPIAVPVLLVIHIGRPFGPTLAEWLRGALPFPSSQAEDGEPLPGPREARVIVAPADRHLVVRNGRLRLTSDAERHGCRPAVDVLFESVAREVGPGAVGCLLTGMGRDGAAGLLAMKRAGAMTLAQDEASSIVFGMPREAIRVGAASRVLGLQEMGSFLSALAANGGRGGGDETGCPRRGR